MIKDKMIDANRKELYELALKLTDFLAEKDRKYADDELGGNIKDSSETWGVEPSKWCCMRINEKVNRMKVNPDDKKIRKEELQDIWGYALLGLWFLQKSEVEQK